VTLPQKNATLIKVNAGGSTVDWDSPDGAGEEKWAGRADGFYTERRERNAGPGAGTSGPAETFYLRRQLIVDARKTRALTFDDRDIVTFLHRGEERQGLVIISEEFDIPNTLVPGEIRLTLQEVSTGGGG
jgi:hypothetical protein